MNSDFPIISHAEIKKRVGAVSFQRGMNYFNQGAIIDPRLQGQTINAGCFGSKNAIYRLQVTFGPSGIIAAKCSCPVGTDGSCKHIAALLLTWVENPKTFLEVENLSQALEKRTKAELIEIIQQMIRREPDLERILELPLPGLDPEGRMLDVQAIEMQVEHAFYNHSLEWEIGAAEQYLIFNELQPLFELAEKFQAQNNTINSALIYRTIAEIMLRYEDAVVQDEDGWLINLVEDCSEGLGSCLEEITDSVQRENIFKTLLNIYIWDLKAGGIGVGDQVPIILITNARTIELQFLYEMSEKALPELEAWAVEKLGSLMLEIQTDSSDELYLNLCRRTGLIENLVDRLLSLNRLNEAIQEAVQVKDYNLINLADVFVEHDQELIAEKLIRERTQTSKDSRLLEWLMNFTRNHGDLVQALDFAKKLFWLSPSVLKYLQMQKLAQPLNQWKDLRLSTLERLRYDEKHVLLTEIYLEEDQIDQALDSLEKAEAANKYWHSFLLQSKVAIAAREKRPKEAVRLYLQNVKHLIALRGRSNYTEAGRFLSEIREILLSIEEPQTWEDLLRNLRDQYKNLPAFQDELNKAGLEL